MPAPLQPCADSVSLLTPDHKHHNGINEGPWLQAWDLLHGAHIHLLPSIVKFDNTIAELFVIPYRVKYNPAPATPAKIGEPR
jgi:hypothetical protein